MSALTMIAGAAALVCAPLAPAQEVDMSREIRVQQIVPSSVSEVWASWTTGEGFEAFAGAPARIGLEPGGEFVIEWAPESPIGEHGSEGCHVLSYHHEKMLSFSWNAPPQFPEVRAQRTTVVLYFDAEGPDRTRLTLYNHGYPEEGVEEQWDEVFEYFSRAWPSVLKTCADHHASKNGVDDMPEARTGWMYVPSPARDDFFTNPDPDENAKVGEHFRYLQQAVKSGKLIMAGPCTNMEGPAVVIFHASDEDEARAFMENDPAVASGVFEATLHPMALSLLRERDSR